MTEYGEDFAHITISYTALNDWIPKHLYNFSFSFGKEIDSSIK